MKIVIEMIRDILCANPLSHLRLVPTPCLFECERPVERVRVFHCYDRGQSPSVLTDREPLDKFYSFFADTFSTVSTQSGHVDAIVSLLFRFGSAACERFRCSV